MVDQPITLNGAIIESVESFTDDDIPMEALYRNNSGSDYGSFYLKIKTNKGTLIYEGCHDCSPDIEIKEN